ncbi:hypothetical protein JRG19_02450 [Pseudoclavibacter alba]|uniref:hypothetical protein n=1 Tax=Pseudoclavibacter albus TaxID=272241 RepID=UPI0019CFDA82|nr:hypothetical protein [Pseudoclavibacter alba]MBN6777411.1 hypothetical protein [Pseudoclavibacter alba]
MADVVPVTVRLPERVWGRLATVAENEGTTVPELIADAIKGRVAPLMEQSAPASKVTKARVVELVAAGIDDGAISRDLNLTRRQVAEIRRRAGLRANKTKGNN